MFVEQAQIQMKDALTDDMEAEVAALDDARVDGAHGDLMHILADHRCRPVGGRCGVCHEGPEWSVSAEAHPNQIMGLALVPLDCRHEVDDARELVLDGVRAQDGRVPLPCEGEADPCGCRGAIRPEAQEAVAGAEGTCHALVPLGLRGAR